MRLGLGLNFLHRLISGVAATAVVGVSYLLQQNGDFLLLEEPQLLLTEDGDTINFGSPQILQTENSNSLIRQVGGFILGNTFEEGANAMTNQSSSDGGKITLEHLA
jgi:hypothetical protein